MTITRLWQAKADYQSLAYWFPLGTDLALSTTQKVNGTHSFRGATSLTVTPITFPTTSQIRVANHFRHVGTSTSEGRQANIFAFYNTGGIVASARYSSFSGLVDLAIGDTSVASAPAGMFANTETWHHIVFDVKIDVNGWMVFYCDGIEIVRFDGDTTGAGASVDMHKWGYSIAGQGWMPYRYIDNLYIDDMTGEAAASVEGTELFFHLMTANGNGANSNYVGSDADSVDNYLLVDDNPPDNDTTYVETDATGNIDTYALSDFTVPEGQVASGMIAFALARATAAGPSIKVRITDGVNNIDGADVVQPTTSYILNFKRTTILPNGSALSEAGINTLEIGYESGGSY